ncbi:hypothetical protein [Allostreptomyces psammosilenae]|uniref:TRAP-type C4-dicarboxylate transport system permease small subunit n=1 Tax=Allostreptomyces psammosilenae TaxID=1892865 RepID=A0A852ZXD1_9ACTN|nr:hypothetical protein [Allostreptomyces psammosilenae]NYI03291.1 TRAP-type C4-dicarboxylate transport system permease small subunit [Allostreptomyces psammosilenae]
MRELDSAAPPGAARDGTAPAPRPVVGDVFLPERLRRTAGRADATDALAEPAEFGADEPEGASAAPPLAAGPCAVAGGLGLALLAGGLTLFARLPSAEMAGLAMAIAGLGLFIGGTALLGRRWWFLPASAACGALLLVTGVNEARTVALSAEGRHSQCTLVEESVTVDAETSLPSFTSQVHCPDGARFAITDDRSRTGAASDPAEAATEEQAPAATRSLEGAGQTAGSGTAPLTVTVVRSEEHDDSAVFADTLDPAFSRTLLFTASSTVAACFLLAIAVGAWSRRVDRRTRPAA